MPCLLNEEQRLRSIFLSLHISRCQFTSTLRRIRESKYCSREASITSARQLQREPMYHVQSGTISVRLVLGNLNDSLKVVIKAVMMRRFVEASFLSS